MTTGKQAQSPLSNGGTFGTTLSRETKEILAQIAASPRYDQDLTPVERREIHDRTFLPLGLRADGSIASCELFLPLNDELVRARLYRSPKEAGLVPVLLHFHGGGMTVGSLEQYDSLCQRICKTSKVSVLTIDYALAPERPFPAAINQAWSALNWLGENAITLGLDPERIAVGGDSAGGNIAAVLSLMARDEGGPGIAAQLLIYPAVGTRGETSSMREFSTGYLFEKEHLETVYDQYLPDPGDISDWRVSPILANDHSNLPPTFVLSAECEIMRDDIEEYARILKESGTDVEAKRYVGMVHPFLSLAGVVPEAALAIDDCALWLTKHLS